jgi:CheY-like chemotaxis protein
MFSQGVRTLDRSDSGLGVGLALAKSVVEMHGGTVSATSEGPGKGCEFVVCLPALARTPPAHAPDAAVGLSPRDVPQSLHVLLVEDNVDMANIFAMYLRSLGHVVRTAHEGRAAVEAAMEFLPQVVLLDIGLPGMDGYAVARRMRKEPALQGAVLVAMTGYGTESDRQRSLKAGFDHHLVKPADHAELRRIFAGAAEAAKAT